MLRQNTVVRSEDLGRQARRDHTGKWVKWNLCLWS